MKSVFHFKENLKIGPAIAWLLCGLAIVSFVWEFQANGVQCDDAFITYRYAANLLHGEGFVYNPGETVDGMYSVLWALLVAGGLSLKLEAETVGYVLGLAFGCATLILTFLYANIGLPRRWNWLSGLAPWIVLSSTSFTLWASSGLGVPLFTLCVTGALLATTQGRFGWAVFAALLATLARPEGIIVAIVIFLYILLIAPKENKKWIISMTVYGLGLLAFISFHQWYFGKPLPSGDYGFIIRDLVYLFYPHSFKSLSSVYHFFASGVLLLIGPLLLAVSLRRDHWPAALYFLAAVIYTAFGPADTWQNSPFLSSVLPALSAAVIHGCITSWSWNRTLSFCALGSTVGAIAFQYFGKDAQYGVYTLAVVSLVIVVVIFRSTVEYRRRALIISSCIGVCALLLSVVIQKPVGTRWPMLRMRTRAEFIAAEKVLYKISVNLANSVAKKIVRKTSKPLIATDQIGRIGYQTGYPIIDLFGRVDPTIRDIRSRHLSLGPESKINALITDYLLQRKPEYILVDYKSGFDSLIAKGIIENRNFRRQFTWDSILDGYTRRKTPLISQSAIDTRLRKKPRVKTPGMRPNIVLISIDTLRADHLDLYGYFRRTAPHLSKLAETGIFFNRAVSQAPWTLPSMATIMTSLYPHQHRTFVARSWLNNSMTTIAERLRVDNYYTLGVVSNYFVSRKVGFAQGFIEFDENVVKIEDEITSNVITQIAEEMLANADREPFFLWTHYMDPHYSYYRHPKYRFIKNYRGRFGHRITIAELLGILEAKKKDGRIEMSPEDFLYLRAVYDEEIAFTDAAVGRLINFVDRMGYARPTVFLVVADHGDLLGEHDDFGHKEYLYDELIHVPLIIGGAIEPSLRNQKVNETVENRDVATTIMKLARVSVHPFKGNDLIEIARRNGDRSEAYSETIGFFTEDLEDKAAISFNKWKLIYNRKSKSYELYDLDADKGEKTNLWRNRQFSAIRGLLKSRLDAFVGRIEAKQRVPKSEITISPSQEKALRALGYIQ